jgi:hypothetical protein
MARFALLLPILMLEIQAMVGEEIWETSTLFQMPENTRKRRFGTLTALKDLRVHSELRTGEPIIIPPDLRSLPQNKSYLCTPESGICLDVSFA